MKKIIFTGLICLFLPHFLFSAEKLAQEIKKELVAGLTQLSEEMEMLVSITQDKPENWDRIEEQFFNARLAFKRVELFMDYLDPEFVKDHINGAPLPHTERKAPNMVILEPHGFQIMEEKLAERELEAFAELAVQLEHKINEFKTRLPSARISERMVFEAMRQSIIRLVSMGIVGFDSPTTLNTLAECEANLKALEKTISFYSTYLTETDLKDLDLIFEQGASYFEGVDFNTFNRFEFIKQVANPLYALLLGYQKKLNIETRDLTGETAYSINYEATNLFDTEFLNVSYFSKYSRAGDLEKRTKLGELLFFDPILSQNNERACASCHLPEKAFSDGRAKSISFDAQGNLDRNTPGLINAVYSSRFFWDVRAETPEDQIEHVLFNPKEFNTNYAEIVTKLNSCTDYVQLFTDAYPEGNLRSEIINRYTLVASISAYIQSLRSFNSPFDTELKSKTATQDQKLVNGFNIFSGKAKCATCHFSPTFAGNLPPYYTDTETEVLGIPSTNNRGNTTLDIDLGRYENGRPKEKAAFNKHAFKTPTLRNINLTGPYMHNGVFETLRDVVDFYNVGGGNGWGIAPENTTLPADSLHLSEKEIDELIYFMETLTDTATFTHYPSKLPTSTIDSLNKRIIGGTY